MARSSSNTKQTEKKRLFTVLLVLVFAVVLVCIVGSSARSRVLITPEIKSAQLTDYGVKLNWTKAKNAEAYRIYRLREGDSSWETIVKSTTARSYIDDSVTGGEEYSYKVRVLAKDSTDNSKRSSEKSVKVPVVSVSSIAFSEGSHKLNIGDKYSLTFTVLPVYVSDISVSFSSSNTNVAKVSSTGEITAVSEGTAKITVKSGDATDSIKVSVRLYTPEAPYGTKIESITNAGIQYYWKKPAKSDGYEVWRYDNDKGEFTLLATIEDKTQCTYVDNTFDKSLSAHKYKVRSFILNEDGSKNYSAFSEVKTARKYKKLTISKENTYMRTGDVRQLHVFYDWGELDNVVWQLTQKSVAAIDKNGKITALKKGKTEIIAYCDSLNRAATCSLTVDRDAPVVEYTAINEYTRKDSDGVWYSDTDKDTGEAVLMFAGDIMCTGAQQRYAADNGLNYNACFDGVRDIIETADFAVANFETITSDGWPYFSEETYIDSKANCNAPSSYIAAVAASGFDAVVTSNNHNCDAGIRGITDTNANLERYNMPYTGTFSSQSQQRFQLFEVNGIKVALFSYTAMSFNGKEFYLTQQERDTYLNIFSNEKVQLDFSAAREAGAEFIVCYMHWGVKNKGDVLPSQEMASKVVAEAGADLIVGGHCHLLQKFDYIETSDGRSVPCAFSLGDFLSSVQQIKGNRDSIILRMEISRNKKGDVVIDDLSYIPCYNKTVHNGIYYYTLPIEKEFNGGYVISHKKTTLARIATAIGDKLPKYSAK